MAPPKGCPVPPKLRKKGHHLEEGPESNPYDTEKKEKKARILT
jgi:hypothetical protein